MKILQHTLTILTFILWIVCAGLGYFWVGMMAFLLCYAWTMGKGEPRKISYDLKTIDKMDGFAFEKLVGELFTKLGYKTKVTQEKGDYGADVVAIKGHDKVAIQCKRYKGAVGIDAVYQILGGQQYYRCNKAMVVTNSTYTEAAQNLARKANVMLIGRKELVKLMNNGNF